MIRSEIIPKKIAFKTKLLNSSITNYKVLKITNINNKFYSTI